MIHDTLRAALLIAVLAAAASIAVETRQRLAVIEIAIRMATPVPPQAMPQPVYHAIPQPEPGRLQRFGRATIDLADAALGVVR